jgi:hypothetical protein
MWVETKKNILANKNRKKPSTISVEKKGHLAFLGKNAKMNHGSRKPLINGRNWNTGEKWT